ncbi:hypothetical protein ARMGADRAFT_818598 [Armillaria gallica]|uniref:Uncharacterized protein n=1 Tax=Armillaria gallica TaxID=47427 RepID=A0A2H3CCT4_ARMGA|nr:hypothetical protein ARMGADRAFT_818598 [Armillaria gallica]
MPSFSFARFSSLVMLGDSCVTAFYTPLIPIHDRASIYVVNHDLLQVACHTRARPFFLDPHMLCRGAYDRELFAALAQRRVLRMVVAEVR